MIEGFVCLFRVVAAHYNCCLARVAKVRSSTCANLPPFFFFLLTPRSVNRIISMMGLTPSCQNTSLMCGRAANDCRARYADELSLRVLRMK